MMKRLLKLALFLAAIGFAGVNSHAADDGTIYEPIKVDGEWFILNKVTGKLTPARDFKPDPPTPPIHSVRETKPDTATVKDPKTAKQTPPKLVPPEMKIEVDDGASEVVLKPAGIKEAPPVAMKPPKTEVANSEPPIQPNGLITDEMRKKAFVDVSSYRSSLSLIQTVQIQGGKIKGTIAVANKGNKKIDMLEITLYVPSGDGLQFEEHHLLFGYKAGLKPPPAPNPEDPDNADSQIMMVDYPAPPGGGKSKVDVKFTYIKFSEE